MKGQAVILHGARQRELAHRLVQAAPPRSVVKVEPEARTLEQNAKMHAMLSDIARAKPEGRTLPPDIWKMLFMAEAGFQFRWEPGLDGQGVVPVGFRSSRLNKAQFSELIEAIQAYGARHGVKFSDEGE